MTARLNVNIDHVATIREARKTVEPSVMQAALICEQAGAHGITVHLRGDRRHIQDSDVEQLKQNVTTYLNLEIAASTEMIAIATRFKPDAVSLVAENPNEITTEGGLDVVANFDNVKNAVEKLKAVGITVSIFIDPATEQIDAAKRAGADQIELCTAEYAEATLSSPPYKGGVAAASADGVVLDSDAEATPSEPGAIATGLPPATTELARLAAAARHAHSIGLIVAAGHGLTTSNVAALAAIDEITEFNIGHHIISHSVFIGLENAVKEMLGAIR